MNEKVNATGESIFIINDIELEIPPTQISVQKEDLYWSWKTLRTKIATKVPSGHGVIHVQLNIIFVPDQLITLHRLVTEFRNSPYCYIKNRYLRNNICESWPVGQNMAFTMVGIDVSSLSENPGSFQVQLSLRWFNYFPYTPNFVYKKDFLTKPIKSSEEGYHVRFTIPTINGSHLNYSQQSIVQKSYESDSTIEPYSAITERVAEKDTGSITLQEMQKTHAGQVFDLSPLPDMMSATSWANPYNSNIYKRFINVLQQKYMYESFGMDLYQYFDQNYIKTKYGEAIYDSFTIGIREERKNKEVQKDSKNPLKVFGWHEYMMPGEIKAMVILKMLASMHDFNIYYDEYKAIYKHPILTDIDIKIKKMSGQALVQKYQKDLGALTSISDKGTSGGFSVSDSTEEYQDYLERLQDPTKKVEGLPEGQHASVTKGLTVPSSGTASKEEDYRYFHPLCGNQLVDGVLSEVTLTISSGYGWRYRTWEKDKVTGEVPVQHHEGIDLRVFANGERDATHNRFLISAPLDGVINKITNTSGGYGRRINIQHADGLVTTYAHLGDSDAGKKVYTDVDGVRREPKKGDMVKRGQVFATVGSTGGSTGAHIHFEVKLNGNTTDPYAYLIVSKGGVAAASASGADAGGDTATAYNVNSYRMSDDGFDALINKWDYTFIKKMGIDTDRLYYAKETSKGLVLKNVDRLANGFEFIPSVESFGAMNLPMYSKQRVFDAHRRYPLQEDWYEIETQQDAIDFNTQLLDAFTSDVEGLSLDDLRNQSSAWLAAEVDARNSYIIGWSSNYKDFDHDGDGVLEGLDPSVFGFSYIFSAAEVSSVSDFTVTLGELIDDSTGAKLVPFFIQKKSDFLLSNQFGQDVSSRSGMLLNKEINVPLSSKMIDVSTSEVIETDVIDVGSIGVDTGFVYKYVENLSYSNGVIDTGAARLDIPVRQDNYFLKGSLFSLNSGVYGHSGYTGEGMSSANHHNKLFEKKNFWKYGQAHLESSEVSVPEVVSDYLIAGGFKVNNKVDDAIRVPAIDIMFTLENHNTDWYKIQMERGLGIPNQMVVGDSIGEEGASQFPQWFFGSGVEFSSPKYLLPKMTLLNVFHEFTKKYIDSYWYNKVTGSILPGEPVAGKSLNYELGKALVKTQIIPIEKEINGKLKNKVSQTQFDTLISLAWDLGKNNNIVESLILSLNSNDSKETLESIIKRRSAYKNVYGRETIYKYPASREPSEAGSGDADSNFDGDNTPHQSYNYDCALSLEVLENFEIALNKNGANTELNKISTLENKNLVLDNIQDSAFSTHFDFTGISKQRDTTMSFPEYQYSSDPTPKKDSSVFNLSSWEEWDRLNPAVEPNVAYKAYNYNTAKKAFDETVDSFFNLDIENCSVVEKFSFKSDGNLSFLNNKSLSIEETLFEIAKTGRSNQLCVLDESTHSVLKNDLNTMPKIWPSIDPKEKLWIKSRESNYDKKLKYLEHTLVNDNSGFIKNFFENDMKDLSLDLTTYIDPTDGSSHIYTGWNAIEDFEKQNLYKAIISELSIYEKGEDTVTPNVAFYSGSKIYKYYTPRIYEVDLYKLFLKHFIYMSYADNRGESSTGIRDYLVALFGESEVVKIETSIDDEDRINDYGSGWQGQLTNTNYRSIPDYVDFLPPVYLIGDDEIQNFFDLLYEFDSELGVRIEREVVLESLKNSYIDEDYLLTLMDDEVLFIELEDNWEEVIKEYADYDRKFMRESLLSRHLYMGAGALEIAGPAKWKQIDSNLDKDPTFIKAAEARYEIIREKLRNKYGNSNVFGMSGEEFYINFLKNGKDHGGFGSKYSLGNREDLESYWENSSSDGLEIVDTDDKDYFINYLLLRKDHGDFIDEYSAHSVLGGVQPYLYIKVEADINDESQMKEFFNASWDNGSSGTIIDNPFIVDSSWSFSQDQKVADSLIWSLYSKKQLEKNIEDRDNGESYFDLSLLDGFPEFFNQAFVTSSEAKLNHQPEPISSSRFWFSKDQVVKLSNYSGIYLSTSPFMNLDYETFFGLTKLAHQIYIGIYNFSKNEELYESIFSSTTLSGIDYDNIASLPLNGAFPFSFEELVQIVFNAYLNETSYLNSNYSLEGGINQADRRIKSKTKLKYTRLFDRFMESFAEGSDAEDDKILYQEVLAYLKKAVFYGSVFTFDYFLQDFSPYEEKEEVLNHYDFETMNKIVDMYDTNIAINNLVRIELYGNEATEGSNFVSDLYNNDFLLNRIDNAEGFRHSFMSRDPLDRSRLIHSEEISGDLFGEKVTDLLETEIQVMEFLSKLIVKGNRDYLNIFNMQDKLFGYGFSYFKKDILTDISDNDLLLKILLLSKGSDQISGSDTGVVSDGGKLISECLEILGIVTINKRTGEAVPVNTNQDYVNFKLDFIRNCIIYHNAKEKEYISSEKDKILYAFPLQLEVKWFHSDGTSDDRTGSPSELGKKMRGIRLGIEGQANKAYSNYGFFTHLMMEASYEDIKDLYLGKEYISIGSISQAHFPIVANDDSSELADTSNFFVEIPTKRYLSQLLSSSSFEFLLLDIQANPASKMLASEDGKTLSYLESVYLPYGNVKALLVDALGDLSLIVSTGRENVSQGLASSLEKMKSIEEELDQLEEGYNTFVPQELQAPEVGAFYDEALGDALYGYVLGFSGMNEGTVIDQDVSILDKELSPSMPEVQIITINGYFNSGLEKIKLWRYSLDLARVSHAAVVLNHTDAIEDKLAEYNREFSTYAELKKAAGLYDLLESRESGDWKDNVQEDLIYSIFFSLPKDEALSTLEPLLPKLIPPGIYSEYKSILSNHFETPPNKYVSTDELFETTNLTATALYDLDQELSISEWQEKHRLVFPDDDYPIEPSLAILTEELMLLRAKHPDAFTSANSFEYKGKDFYITPATLWKLIERYIKYLIEVGIIEKLSIDSQILADYIIEGSHPFIDDAQLEDYDPYDVDTSVRGSYVDIQGMNSAEWEVIVNDYFYDNFLTTREEVASSFEKTYTFFKGFSSEFLSFSDYVTSVAAGSLKGERFGWDTDGGDFGFAYTSVESVQEDSQFLALSFEIDTLLPALPSDVEIDDLVYQILKTIDDKGKLNLETVFEGYSHKEDSLSYLSEEYNSKRAFLEKNTKYPVGYSRLLQIYEHWSAMPAVASDNKGFSTFFGTNNYFYEYIQYYNTLFLSDGSKNGRAQDELTWFFLEEAAGEAEDVHSEEGIDTGLNLEFETDPLELSKEQKEALSAYELAINAEVANGWEIYKEINGLTNVLKRTIKDSYSNPNYQYSLNIDFMKKYFKNAAEQSTDSNYKLFIAQAVRVIGSGNLVDHENLKDYLTYWKEHIISRVSGSMAHVVSSIPLINQPYPTSQHLGSIEPSYSIEMVSLPDLTYSDGLNNQTKRLVRCLSTLQENSRRFRQVPDSYSFSLDTFITRLFGSFTEMDYSIHPEDPFNSKLLKRICCTKQFTQTMPGNPGVSNLMLSLEETNPFKVEKIVSEDKGTKVNRSNIKEALHALYDLQLNDDARTYLLMKKFAQQMNGIEGQKYLEEKGVSDEQLKKITSFAIIAEADSSMPMQDSYLEINSLDLEEGVTYYTPDDLYQSLAIDVPLGGDSVAVPDNSITSVINSGTIGFLPFENGTGSEDFPVYTISEQWFSEKGYQFHPGGYSIDGKTISKPIYVKEKGGEVTVDSAYGSGDNDKTWFALPLHDDLICIEWTGTSTLNDLTIYTLLSIDEAKSTLKIKYSNIIPAFSKTGGADAYKIPDAEADFWEAALSGSGIESTKDRDGNIYIAENSMKDYIGKHFEYYEDEKIQGTTTTYTGAVDHTTREAVSYTDTRDIGYSTTNFYAANPAFNTLLAQTGEETIILLEEYYDILIQTFKKVRFTLAETEAGGLDRDAIKKALYDFGNKPEQKGVIEPFMYRNFLYFLYRKFFNSLNGASEGATHEGLRWTSSRIEKINYVLGYDATDLNAYFSSIIFDGIYESTEGISPSEESSVRGFTPSEVPGYTVHRNLFKEGEVTKNSTFNLSHYWIHLYDSDVAEITSRSQADNTSRFDEVLTAAGSDKSVIAGFANILSPDASEDLGTAGTTTLERGMGNSWAGGALENTAEALTMNSDFEKLNRLQEYVTSRVALVADYTEFATNEKGIKSGALAYIPTLAPYIDDLTGDSSVNKHRLSLGSYYTSFDGLAEKLFSPRAVLDRDLEVVADWGGRSTIGRESSYGNKYALGQSTEGTFYSVGANLVGGTMDNTLGMFGGPSGGASVTGGVTKLGGWATGRAGLTAAGTGLLKVGSIPATGVIGGTLSAVDSAGMLISYSGVGGMDGSYMWNSDKLLEISNMRDSGTFGNWVDDALFGYTIASPYNADNAFERSRGKGDIRVRPEVIKRVDLSQYTDLELEQRKLDEVMNILTELGRSVLDNPEVAAALNLTGKSANSDFSMLENNGEGCYPDLDLPLHPYYNHKNSYAISPDFYFWNIYEDGDHKVKKQFTDLIQENANLAISHSYNHMRRMQAGGIVSKTNRNLYVKPTEVTSIEPAKAGGELPLKRALTHHPEGSPQVDWGVNTEWSEELSTFINWNTTGANVSAFAETTEEAKKKPSRIENYKNLKAQIAKEEDSSKKEAMEIQLENLILMDSDSESIFRPITYIDNFDGLPPGVYQKTNLKVYEEYHQKIRGIEKMFGSRAGYTGNYLSDKIGGDKTKKLAKEAMDNGISMLDEFSHSFDYKSLTALCRDSANDILSQKWSMKRAYPTFKLFFIEEDELESRFINFDDFYSFNGVKQFVVNRDRETAADTAVITLQNVSGTLDGTKRGAVVDLDYFEKHMDKVIKSKEGNDIELRSNNNEMSSMKDQPFTSIVLRPGSNVQLRCGYSNDPNMLEVLISGRLVDIAWSQNGDLCEITVQSFGAELVQHIKGMNAMNTSSENRIYPATHHLLGTLMLSPEIQHFGRWEFGQSYQYGEAKDHKLDLFKYKDNSSFFGMFELNFSHKLSSTISTGMLSTAAIISAIVAVRFGALNSGTLSGAKSLLGPTGAKILSAAGTTIDDAGKAVAHVADDALRVVPKGAEDVAVGTLGFGLDGIKNVFKAILSPMLPRQLLQGNQNMMVKGVHAFKEGGAGILEAGAAWGTTGQNVISRGAGGFLKVATWLSGGGSRALKYSDEVVDGVTELVRVFNRSAKMLVKGSTIMQSHAGAFMFKTDKLIEALKAGSQINKPLVGARESLRVAIEAAKKGPPGSWNAVLNAQAEVLQSINSVDRLARLNAVTNGNLFQMFNQTKFMGQGAALGKSLLSGYFSVFAALGIGGTMYSFGTILVDAGVGIFNYMFDGADYRKEYMKLKANLVLEPQDDNLYPPNPLTYMRLEELEEETWTDWFSDIFTLDVLGPGDFAAWALGGTTDFFERFTSKPKYITKRVTAEAAKYVANNNTVWEIFREMTLRHPGWIYAAVPYGNKLTYTMFFGVPSQRYWSKPASNTFISRMNRLRDLIGVPSPNEAVLKKQWSYFYSEEDYDKVKAEHMGNYEMQFTAGEDLGDSTEIVEAGYDDLRTPAIESHSEEKVNKQVMLEMSLMLKTRAMEEYLIGLENRFVPFRRYHNIDSEKDIVANNIMGSNKNVVNAVNVHFLDPDGATQRTLQMKASSSIKDDEINMANVSDYTSNVKSKHMALRYGMGELIYGMKEMYRGELLILGNPRIKPWDICYLFDSYTDMFGPFEVKAVTHTFSHETGFLTEIVPNAVVIGNEVSSQPIIEGLKLFVAAVKDKERNFGKIDASGVDKGFPDNISLGGIIDLDYTDDLKEKYADKVEQGYSFEDIWNNLNPETRETFSAMSENEIIEALTGYSKFGLRSMEEASKWVPTNSEDMLGATIGGLGAAAMAETAVRDPLAKSGIVSPFTTAKLGKRALWAIPMGVIGGLLSGRLVTHGRDEMREDGSILETGDLLNNNENWLASAPILFSKFMEEEAVCVLPLIKEGQPIVSGMSLRDPMAFWKSTFGVITNRLNDSIRGVKDYEEQSSKYGMAYWNRLRQLNTGLIKDRRAREMVRGLLNEDGLDENAIELSLADRFSNWSMDIIGVE